MPPTVRIQLAFWHSNVWMKSFHRVLLVHCHIISWKICSDSLEVIQGSARRRKSGACTPQLFTLQIASAAAVSHLRASRRLKCLPGAEPQLRFIVDIQAWTKPIFPSHLITHSEVLAAELKIHRGTHTQVLLSWQVTMLQWEPPSQSEIWSGCGHGMGKDSRATLGSWAVTSNIAPNSSGVAWRANKRRTRDLTAWIKGSTKIKFKDLTLKNRFLIHCRLPSSQWRGRHLWRGSDSSWDRVGWAALWSREARRCLPYMQSRALTCPLNIP